MRHYLDAAVQAACAAGEMLRHNFEKPMQVNQSTKHDIKLEIDVRAQELITQSLIKEFPQHALYGEEGIVGDQASEFQWVVDPLDGTVNYYYGIPHFCVSIALRCQAEIIVGVIFDPIRNELWTAQKGAAPKLNDREFRVSERADLAEAIVSVGLSKTGITIEAGIPLLQTMVHRARANAACSAAPRSTWPMSRAADSTPTSSRALVCGTWLPVGFWWKRPAVPWK